MQTRVKRAFAEHFDEEIQFFKSWISKPKAVGAVLPTSSITARRMASVINPENNAKVLELGPGIDSAEAARATSNAHDYSLQLAQEYRITDPLVIHNAKIKSGLRERGLCNHFAEDILKRMDQEGFRTLDLHWAA